MKQQTSSLTVRYTVVTAMLSAVSVVLQFLEFPVPFLIPDFIKMDFSDLPALIASFSMGPVYGAVVCLIKNFLHFITATTTGGVGELANFMLSGSFVVIAGLIYRFRKNRSGALFGSLLGAVIMGILSVPINYYITYPIYYHFLPEDVILGAYQAILPFVDSILTSLFVFNAPFTFLKGALVTLITFLIYKHISPFIKGNK